MEIKVIICFDWYFDRDHIISYFTDNLSNLPMIGEKIHFHGNDDDEYNPSVKVIDKEINYRPDMSVEFVKIFVRYPFHEWFVKWFCWLHDHERLLKPAKTKIGLSNDYLFSVFKELKYIVPPALDVDLLKRNQRFMDLLTDGHITLLEHFIDYFREQRKLGNINWL